MTSGLRLEETELRLGLPGGGGGCGGEAEVSVKSSGKRGFLETIDLKLKLHTPVEGKELESTEKENKATDAHEKPPAPKAQVVGWPPVRSFRKNILNVQQHPESKNKEEQSEKTAAASVAAFVKVSMDGAPYLRKVDLKTYKSYQDLSMALQKMFSSFTTSGNYGTEQGISVRDFMNDGKVTELVINGSEFVPTFEDKDGDWMLVGDVPWEMFVDSCKRLRIMKGSEAVGLGKHIYIYIFTSANDIYSHCLRFLLHQPPRLLPFSVSLPALRPTDPYASASPFYADYRSLSFRAPPSPLLLTLAVSVSEVVLSFLRRLTYRAAIPNPEELSQHRSLQGNLTWAF
ncbi:hypothetical protein ZIOFF_015036 [Zingiber officinale]|uniref:Auxin-responsive protein n=1 Tax=Zingiber officinale TaxID=94328 RepID=A0A8J5HQQ9_ZINOF|nr:hypothetical protein ZIOFF_015036 [Zingiber officinale]